MSSCRIKPKPFSSEEDPRGGISTSGVDVEYPSYRLEHEYESEEEPSLSENTGGDGSASVRAGGGKHVIREQHTSNGSSTFDSDYSDDDNNEGREVRVSPRSNQWADVKARPQPRRLHPRSSIGSDDDAARALSQSLHSVESGDITTSSSVAAAGGAGGEKIKEKSWSTSVSPSHSSAGLSVTNSRYISRSKDTAQQLTTLSESDGGSGSGWAATAVASSEKLQWNAARPTKSSSAVAVAASRDKDDAEAKQSSSSSSSQRPHELSIFSCVHQGVDSAYVQCVVRRSRGRGSLESRLYPSYDLVLERTGAVLLTAQKMQRNRTANYHLFDMTRGVVEGSPLTKKSGNYIGKLRARSGDRSDYVLLARSSGTMYAEMAGVHFDRAGGLLEQYLPATAAIASVGAGKPRKMRVILPPIDSATMTPAVSAAAALSGGHATSPSSSSGAGAVSTGRSLLDMLQAGDVGRFYVFESKTPALSASGHSYQLDFRGRVTQASVKNFQLASEDDIEHVVCQFGKKGDDTFVMDFQAPLNAVQAFSLALCQFNV